MKKTYFVRRTRETEVEWVLDVQDFEPIEADNLKEAKAIVTEQYGGFRNFRKITRKYHPEIAGIFAI